MCGLAKRRLGIDQSINKDMRDRNLVIKGFSVCQKKV